MGRFSPARQQHMTREREQNQLSVVYAPPKKNNILVGEGTDSRDGAQNISSTRLEIGLTEASFHVQNFFHKALTHSNSSSVVVVVSVCLPNGRRPFEALYLWFSSFPLLKSFVSVVASSVGSVSYVRSLVKCVVSITARVN